MSGLLVLTLTLLAPPDPPVPKLDDAVPIEAPLEGPAPAPAPAPAPEPVPESPGIEFAEPPEEQPVEDDPAAPEAEPRATPEIWWPDPGNAPADGSGFLMSGGLLVPTALVTAWVLLHDPGLNNRDRTAIWVTTGGMELIAAIGLGMGLSQRLKLVRWANAYRVIPSPQGGGLLALGGFGVTTGLTLVPLGIWVIARGGSSTSGLIMLAAGAFLGGVIAPLGLSFGRRRNKAYQETGGWRRRPIPELNVKPTLSITTREFCVGVHGHF